MMHGLSPDYLQLAIRPGADLHPLCRDPRVDAGPEAPLEGEAMNPASEDQPPPLGLQTPQPHMTASGRGANVTGVGHFVNTGKIIHPPAPPVRTGVSFDTKALLVALILDVAMFLYGMLSYSGKNTNTETWRAVIFLLMCGVTIGMIRRWFRRRT